MWALASIAGTTCALIIGLVFAIGQSGTAGEPIATATMSNNSSSTPLPDSPLNPPNTTQSKPWVADVTRLDATNVMVSFNISNERVLELWANVSCGSQRFSMMSSRRMVVLSFSCSVRPCHALRCVVICFDWS